jgi:hypothetical protein
MGLFRLRVFTAIAVSLICTDVLFSQTPAPTSGEITVQLTQGLDSAANLEGISQGKVTKSTNPSVPLGSTAMLGLGSDPVNGGYTVKLLRLGISGQMIPAASSDVVTAPDFINKMKEKTRAKGLPQDAASGTRVFLPELMIVRFTLTTPSVEKATQRERPQPAEPQAPKGWKIDKLPEIGSSGQDIMQTAATLRGQTILNGKTSGAILVMHCDFPTKDFPGQLPLETILGGTDEMFNAPGAPGAFVDISEFTSSRLGTADIPVNANAVNRTTGARLRFFYDASDLEQIVNGAGQRLRLSVSSGSSSSPTAVATFALPTDNTPVKEVMSSCLQKSASNAQVLQAKTVASCPGKDGKILDSVDLKYADTGKEVRGDMNEDDNGGIWKLASIIKGRPVRKTVMTCSYRDSGTPQGSPTTDKLNVPVPAAARMCEFNVHKNEAHSEGFCLSIPSAEIALNTGSAGALRFSTGVGQDSSQLREIQGSSRPVMPIYQASQSQP